MFSAFCGVECPLQKQFRSQLIPEKKEAVKAFIFCYIFKVIPCPQPGQNLCGLDGRYHDLGVAGASIAILL
jgi:hypothetical protein